MAVLVGMAVRLRRVDAGLLRIRTPYTSVDLQFLDAQFVARGDLQLMAAAMRAGLVALLPAARFWRSSCTTLRRAR